MWKTLWVLAAVAYTFFVPTSGSSDCNNPPPPKCPKPNEIYDPCLNPCPPRYCGVQIAAISCAKVEVCTPGCRCRDGTLRNADGVCIPEEECPKCNKPNEVYDVCPAKCPPRECGVNIAVILCKVPPKPGDPECEPGCRCRDGFLRNGTNICIPTDDCPKCKGQNEEYDVCPAPCPPQRCHIDPLVRCKEPPKPGDPECKPGCRCIYGFVRNNNDVCIRPEDCPPLCGENEVPSDCINGGCQAKNCSQLGQPIPCVKIDPKDCIKGCLCQDGYLRDHNGVCIPENKCKPKCPKNQVYDTCVNGGCRRRKCSDTGILCIDPIKCKGGCRCKDGYVLNENGECIPEDCCPKICTGAHEVYDPCASTCPPQTCESLNKTYHCPIQPAVCKGACVCEKGFKRNKIGECIAEADCLKCLGPHEYFSCGGACDNFCKNIHEQNQTNCPIVNVDCNRMCYCEKDFARNENKICIPIKDCPVSCGGDPNAEPGCDKECKRRCPGQQPTKCECPCKGSCRCKDGFLYDAKVKKCVCPKDCSSPVCPKHEVFSDCANACGIKNCSQLGLPIPFCFKTDPKDCVPGCLCEEGYLRADNGMCIPKDKCPVKCPQLHEIYDPCPPNCPPQTCESIGKTFYCPIVQECHGECRCEKGYYRNKRGECISEADCLKCTGPNEYFSCRGACDNVCATLHEQNQTNCPIKNKRCNPMCYCDEGYARDRHGICIPIDQCPYPLCGPDERYEENPLTYCEPLDCSEVGFPIDCPIEYPGWDVPPICVCKFGYVRNKWGICIPKTRCPSCGGDPNAIAGSGVKCGNTCSDYNKPVNCVPTPYPNGCDCRKGFVYDEVSKLCVRPEHCPPICNLNEVYDSCANGGCSKRNCSQINNPEICIRVKECIGACVCRKGYLRNSYGVCVPEDQCPRLVCCKNEKYEECPSDCVPRKCSQLGFPIPCPVAVAAPNVSPSCTTSPACVCEDGYVRNDQGVCIPVNNCPSCGGDPNAVSGGSNHCGNRCSDYNKGPLPCPLFRVFNGCDCRPGFVFDDNTGKCVLPRHCTPTCGVNEVFDTCVNGGCRIRNCSDVGGPILCIDPIKCKSGCRCKDGYVLAENGVCVPIDQCPKVCTGINEYYDPCPSDCSPGTCESIGKSYSCPSHIDCKGACVCKKGFYRSKIGECISKKDCLKCTGPHEYFRCWIACDNVCSNIHEQNQTNCPIVNIQCNSKCYCEKDYARDRNGICIPLNECPCEVAPICPVNQVYDSCVNGGCRRRTCADPGTLCIDPTTCEGGCRCKDGYVLNDNSVCVPVDECPMQCYGIHEVYDPCMQTCPPQTCESINKTYFCPLQPAVCKGGCVCEDGYKRNKIGDCIAVADCLKCTGPHEFFSCGGACDNVCETIHKQNQTSCPIRNIVCNRRCYCESDYARDKNGICIPIKDCPPPTCGVNEVFDTCVNGGCRIRNCSDVGGPILCIDPIKCKSGCRCKDGYVLAENGVCVPIDQCPKVCTGINEYYDPCPSDCSPGTCESIGKSYSCPSHIDCKGACVCKKGFYRSKIGECISKKDCLKCTGPHEYFRCWIACDNVCSNIHEQNQTNCPIINIQCNSKCYCEKDYARNRNGICIPLNECPCEVAPICPVNQVYDSCVNGGCRRRTCADPGTLCIDPTTCEGGCRCKDGYVLNDNSVCVPVDECPKQCYGIHEVYDPCMQTCPPQTCESINKTYFCPLQPAVCKGGCVCEDGYKRNKIGDCIAVADCLKCTGPHEFFSCGGACDNVCETIHKQNQTSCPIRNIVCNRRCYCESDYARDKNGICIPIKDCPPSCPVNQVYDTCVNGGCRRRNCSDIGGPIICIDPIKCEGGCRCKDEYLLAANGVCIPIDDCPKPTCPKNEVYDICANGGCKKRKCSQLGKPIVCTDPLGCIGDCVCVDGFLRNENGVCVPENQCPFICNKPHEVYKPCPAQCPPQTCESLDKVYACPIICDNKDGSNCNNCEGACVCEDGYYRNLAGECITEKECRLCKGQNEFYSCRAPCDNECETLYIQNQTSCPLDSIECKCFCAEGTARDYKGICIPILDCPDPRCGPNERYEENPTTYCEPLDCTEVGFPIDCPIIHPGCDVPPICVCKFGYVRNELGICIPKTKCPSCGGDPNAIAGSGVKCGNTCSDYNKPVNCVLTPYPNGCDCRKGFVYDEVSKLCVRPEKCPPQNTTPPATLNNTEIEGRLNNGSIALTGEFVYQLLTSKPQSSFVASATSLLIPLAQIAYFGTGLVLEQLLKILNLRSIDEIKSVYPGIIAKYGSQKEVTFELATTYFFNINYQLSSNFNQFSLDVFNASGQNIDFAKNVEAAKTINTWVEDKTHNRIKDLVSPDMLNSDTRLVCVNAIYFLGNWVNQFNPNNTKVRDFYLDETNTIQIPIMYQEQYFNYYKDDGLKIQALEMFYKGGNFSFLVILPRDKGVEAVKTVAGKLRDHEVFLNIIQNMNSHKVQASLPKMLIETSMDMAEMLKKANVTEMFDPRSDGFRGILEKPEPIHVSAIVQKAFIAVDETGTEAAAATGIIITTTSLGTSFDATRPYLYYLLLNKIPVFCGAFFGHN